MKTNARQIAFDVLLKIFKDNAFSNLTLDFALKKNKLDAREKAFAAALVYGVCERAISLDYMLEKYLSKPISKLKPQVLIILRLGAYQILFMDSVPVSAAVNESVKLSKTNGCAYASGLINAVLRNVSKNGFVLPDDNNVVKLWSVKYSCPQWLIKKWIDEYGTEKTKDILTYSLKENKMTIRVNTLKTSPANLRESLISKGLTCENGAVENSLVISELPCSVEELEEFKNGLFHVQGLPSQLCAKALGVKEGNTVFDLCAAPGGKSFTVAEIMNGKGTVRAFDFYESRVSLIKSGASRLGITIISATTGDALVFDESFGKADCVLCDVPCSGLGIISKKPEIKFKKKEDLESLPHLQYKILKNGSKYVKNGGRLVYSTCTLSKAENENVCARFLEENPDFYAEKPFSDLTDDCFVTFFPSETNSDGFFVALFIRKESK